MDALFIVPTLVSPNCNARMVPALAKVIERNIIIQNSALFRDAALLRHENSTIANIKGSAKRTLRGVGRTAKRIIGLESNTFILSNFNLEESSIYTDFLLESSSSGKGKRAHPKFDKMSVDYDEYTLDDLLQYITYANDDIEYLKDKTYNAAEKYNKTSNDMYFKNYKATERETNKRIAEYENLLKAIKQKRNEEKRKRAQEIRNNKELEDRQKREQLERLQKEERDADKLFAREEKRLEKEERSKDKKEDIKKTIRQMDREDREDRIKKAKLKREIKTYRSELKRRAREDDKATDVRRALSKTSSAETQYQPKRSFTSLDQVEQPIGVQFYSQVSLEPTILEIPINYNPTGYSETQSTVLVKIGVKCIPYTVDGVTNILNLLKESNKMNSIERYFINVWRRWESRLPFTKKRAAKKGNYFNPDEGRFMIKYSPNFEELNNPDQIAKELKSSRTNSPWSTMIMLSSLDFESEDDLKDIVRNYGKLSKFVFGDVVITNDTNESVYFCTPKYRNCQELQYAYLQKVMNLDNIIDYSTLARQQNPWQSEARPRRSRMDKAIKESILINNNKKFKKNIIKEMYLSLMEEDCPDCLKKLRGK